MSLYVYLAALTTSAQAWEDASEDVRGARKSLSDIDMRLLGDRVARHAEVFVDTWMDETTRLVETAADHGDTLRDAARLYTQADADAIARSQQLLAWTDRNVSPNGGL